MNLDFQSAEIYLMLCIKKSIQESELEFIVIIFFSSSHNHKAIRKIQFIFNRLHWTENQNQFNQLEATSKDKL